MHLLWWKARSGGCLYSPDASSPLLSQQSRPSWRKWKLPLGSAGSWQDQILPAWHAKGQRKCEHLTAPSPDCGHERVSARLGTQQKASLVQTVIKSLSCGGETLPNKSFPVVRYLFFFLSRHHNSLICKCMYKSPEGSLNLSLNYWKFIIIIFSWKKSRMSYNPSCSHLL